MMVLRQGGVSFVTSKCSIQHIGIFFQLGDTDEPCQCEDFKRCYFLDITDELGYLFCIDVADANSHVAVYVDANICHAVAVKVNSDYAVAINASGYPSVGADVNRHPISVYDANFYTAVAADDLEEIVESKDEVDNSLLKAWLRYVLVVSINIAVVLIAVLITVNGASMMAVLRGGSVRSTGLSSSIFLPEKCAFLMMVTSRRGSAEELYFFSGGSGWRQTDVLWQWHMQDGAKHVHSDEASDALWH